MLLLCSSLQGIKADSKRSAKVSCDSHQKNHYCKKWEMITYAETGAEISISYHNHMGIKMSNYYSDQGYHIL